MDDDLDSMEILLISTLRINSTKASQIIDLLTESDQ